MRFGFHAAVTLIILTTVTAAPAYAAVLGFHVTTDTVSAPGFVINTITVDVDTDLTAVGAYAQLASGTMNQLTYTPVFPDPETAPPTIDFGPTDSYVLINEEASTSASAGGSADIGGGVIPIFNSTGMDLTWANTAKTDIGVGLPIGRFVFSDDAQGTWNMAVATAFNPKADIYLYNTLVDGHMVFNPLPGDLNHNGFVGIEDLNVILSNWDETIPPAGPQADPSGDGVVGIEDLNVVLGNWNTGLVPLVPGSNPYQVAQDMDGDGFVGIDDLNIWFSNWDMTVPPADPRADTSGDDFVGIEDKVWATWNAGTPPMPAGGVSPPGVVPEPGTAALAGVGVGLLACRRRSR